MTKSSTRLNQIGLLFVLSILVLGFQSCSEKPKEKEETLAGSNTEITSSQLNMTTEKIYGKEFEYDFKDYVIIDLTFSSDTALYWIERTSGTDANEKINTIHLNEYKTLTSWIEHDKTIVSLYSDFSTGKTYGYQIFDDGTIRKLIGTIKLNIKH